MAEEQEASARRAMKAAFEALPVVAGREYFVEAAINDVFLWVQPRRIDPHFANIGRKGVRSEFQKIAKLANALESELREIHRPTYEKLYDAGMRPYEIMDFCRRLSNACFEIDIADLPVRIPRSKSAFVGQNIAVTLRHYYRDITGNSAAVATNYEDGKSYGPFLELVRSVFDAVGVKDSPESCARYAVRKNNELKNAAIIPLASKVVDP